jgi:hypothetical protein
MITVHTAAERPGLWKVGYDAPSVWPEYNRHGDVISQWWGLLDEELPEFQFVLYDDEADSVLAQGFTGPLAWTGQDEALPDGIDPAIEQIFAQRRSRAPVSALCAPVRPSWKQRYPLTPIEDYIRWRRADGQLLDPWLRTHERLGARVATPLPRSLRITGTVADWESWTDLAYPQSGDYVFPEGLATVHIDRTADRGSYWKPNVWLIHPGIED